MDELETLNMLLRAIGSSPVNGTDTDHPDAANARVTMERVSRKVQRKGWWCNIDYNIELEPNKRGEIVFGDQISSVVTECRNYVKRGNRLYDNIKQTATFTDKVRLIRQTRILEWDEMPDVMQEYCAYAACAEFIRDELEDPQKEASFAKTASASYLDLKKQELEEAQYNTFNKDRVIRARGGIRPYWKSGNGSKFYGTPDV